jgi:Arc/MetJ-type ribon-helix-helix transcriptional regulator
MVASKSRLSVTVAKDVLDDIERSLRTGGFRSRSAVVEAALRTWAARERDAQIHAYYDNLTSEERAEDLQWAELGYEAMVARTTGQAKPKGQRRRRRRTP